jgi:hypothetical protein
MNLTKLQRRKLYLHECCAHEGFDNLNRWIREGRFPDVNPSLANIDDPQCISCNFGKARRRSHNSNIGHISAHHKCPGAGVSSDGMEASTPGRPFTTKGQPSNIRFKYASFWIDHASSLVYVTFHQTKAVSELLSSKAEFEQWAARYNVSIKAIRADNGVYAAQAFKHSCMQKQQKLTFCVVGAHWQNGIAERFIGTITKRARTILLHAMHRWPSVIQEELWPFAVRHAVAFHNASTRKGRTSCPHRLFTGEDPPYTLQDFRIFGSPAYVLKKGLQDGGKMGKWESRSWQGVYIGHSSCHSGSIPLIYNPVTTHLSPQYHVIYDEFFQTVATTSTKTLDDHLDHFFGTSATWEYKDSFTDEPYIFDSLWDGESVPAAATIGKKRKRRLACQPLQSTPFSSTEPPSRGSTVTTSTTDVSNSTLVDSQGTALHSAQEAPHGTTRSHVGPDHTQGTALSPPAEAPQSTALPTSHEDTTPQGTAFSTAQAALDVHTATSSNDSFRGSSLTQPITPDLPRDLMSYYEDYLRSTPVNSTQTIPHHTQAISCPNHTVTYMAKRPGDTFTSYKRRRLIDDSIYVFMSTCHHVPPSNSLPTIFEDLNPIFKASADVPQDIPPFPHACPAVDNKADTLTQSQMLRDSDRAQFIASQHAEIRGLLKLEVFDVRHISTKPQTAKLLSSIWS